MNKIYNKDYFGNEINVGSKVIIPKRNSNKIPDITEGSCIFEQMEVINIEPTIRQFWYNCNLVYIPKITLKNSKGKTKIYYYPRSCIVINKEETNIN